MEEGNEGAEKLSFILNNIFRPLVQLVYADGGGIPYFAGDSFTAIFPSSLTDASVEKLIQTALRAKALFSEQDKKFGDFKIGIKIGLAFGQVEWGIVGEENQHLAYYFRGEAIYRCAKSQVQARQQEIVVDESLKNSLLKEYTLIPKDTGFYMLYLPSTTQVEEIRTPSKTSTITEEVAAKFLPKPVIDFAGHGEFRTVVAVFISFLGIETHEQLNRFASIILKEIYNFSGYFKEIDFGDKGGVMVGFFGAPVSFENNMERALEFVTAIREELERVKWEGMWYRIGMTNGTAYTGIVGGEERCQYAAVGNRVNLAARLMTFADWGEVLVDDEVQKSRQFKFKHKGNIQYKGIEGDVPTYKLVGRNVQGKLSFSGSMVGRESELKQLKEFAQPIFQHKTAGIAYIYGEAGIGKSRLAFELRRQLQQQDIVSWYTCQADQILKKPLNPFVYFLKTYFEQSPENTARGNYSNFERNFDWLLEDISSIQHPDRETISRELRRTQSILAGLLGIAMPDSLWEQLDARGRYQNTLSALTNLILAEALVKPVVLYLEDGHWFDDLSKTFLANLVRHIQAYPIFILVTSRYNDDNTKSVLLPESLLAEQQLPHLEIDLNFLSSSALHHFAMQKLNGKISNDFHDLLMRATNGNPFYLEQILEYFKESDLLMYENGEWNIKDSSIKLSNSIYSILTARIDRLSALVKETVKAAAVIGREFELPILSEVMRVQEEFAEQNGNAQMVLREQIETAEKGQIWQAMNELRYIFKHSLLREAVYGMQLRTRLRELHRLIAEAIEKLYHNSIEERYVDLAFHYEQAEVAQKTDFYLLKAADYARWNFQNKQALVFYNKLLDNIIEPEKRAQRTKVLLKKASVLELIGQWEEASKAVEEALQLARALNDKQLMGRTNVAFGHLLLLRGDYEEARLHLEIGATFFEFLKDNIGKARAYGNLGNLYFRQGQYNEAKAYFLRSIEMLRAENQEPNPQTVATLGLTYMNVGQYEEGIRLQQNQLNISQKNNDKKGMATLFTNMGIVYFEKGDYEEALYCYQKGLALSEELGDKQLTAIAIGCIGSVYERQGDYEMAMKNFVRDLQVCEELGDKQGMAIAAGLIGDLLSVKGDFDEAIQYLQRELELSQSLGYQKGIAKALNTLGDVYFYKNDYQLSVDYYDQAIEVTRKISNKLVLGFSLVEKGLTLMKFGQSEAIPSIQQEAMALAEELGNPDLLFQATILRANWLTYQNNTQQAAQLLYNLLDDSPEADKAAAVHFELAQLFPQETQHKEQALELYRQLYQETPRYSFYQRIQQLEQR